MALSEQFRYPARKYDRAGEHIGPGMWLDVIHCANALEHGMFGEPLSTGPWWAGGYVEEYEAARVLHRDQDEEGNSTSVSIIPKTPHAADILAKADAAAHVHSTAQERP